MMISTRGRYALRVMIDLAEQSNGQRIPLKDIAQRQHISQKYVEGIMTTLSKNGLISGVHGKGGGYCLTREPKDYSTGEILNLTEGTLAPVSCLGADAALPVNEPQTAKHSPSGPSWMRSFKITLTV